MTTSQNPTENQDIYMEEEGMKALRRLVDECARGLSEQDLFLGQAETWIEKTREQVLESSNWMGIAIQPCPISSDRFKLLLKEGADLLQSR